MYFLNKKKTHVFIQWLLVKNGSRQKRNILIPEHIRVSCINKVNFSHITNFCYVLPFFFVCNTIVMFCHLYFLQQKERYEKAHNQNSIIYLLPRVHRPLEEMEQILFLILIFLSFAFSGRCSDVYSRNDFPKGFVFGSAVSAFQVWNSN